MDDLNKKTILDLAKEATEGRMKSFGHPNGHFNVVAKLWTSFLDLQEYNLTAKDIALMMILFKVARALYDPNKDTLADIAGYARTIEMLKEETEDAD